MSWSEKVYRYCERGQDPAFWAEPFNALSNGAIIVVAVLATHRLRAVSGGSTAERRAVALLIAVAIAIGVGSFLFHTLASRWSRLADVIPIAAFMVGYLVLALRLFMAWPATRIAGACGLFVLASALVAIASCPSQIVAVTTFAREPCLKGSMGYLPALAALALTGALLNSRHPAGRLLLGASGVFLAAMLVRWVDRSACASSVLLGAPRGTHALWHVLVAVTLHLLLAAAIGALAGRPPTRGGSPSA